MRTRATLLLIILGCAAVLQLSRKSSADEPSQPLMRREAAVQALQDATSSDKLKIDACRALAALGNEARSEKINVIRAGVGTGPLHDEAVIALRAIDPDAAADLISILKTGLASDADAAADVLSSLSADADPAVEPLWLMLNSQNFAVFYRAIHVIDRLGPVAKVTAPVLQQLCMNRAWEVRTAAARALVSVTRDQSHALRDPFMDICAPQLVLQSDDASPDEVAQACRQLGEVGPGAIFAAYDLQAHLNDAPPAGDAAYAATMAIGRDLFAALPPGTFVPRPHSVGAGKSPQGLLNLIANATSVTELRHLLESPDAAVREWACKTLRGHKFKARPALPKLRELLNDKDADVRLAAASAIEVMDEHAEVLSAVEDLQPLLSANWPATLRTLLRLADQGIDVTVAIGPVGDRLFAVSPETRELAAAILSKAGSPGDKQAIAAVRAIDDRARTERGERLSVFARLATLKALVRLDPGGIASYGELPGLLGDPRLGESVAQIIFESGPHSAPLVPQLVELAKIQGQMRVRALHALAGIVSPATTDAQTIAALTGALADKDADIRKAAAAALGKIGSAAKDSLGAVAHLLGSSGNEEVAVAARALAEFGPDSLTVLPDIVAILRSRLPATPTADNSADEVRAACADAVGKLAPSSEEATDLLLLAVTRKDWVVRERLAPAIALAKDKPARLLVNLNALADRSPDDLVRVNARCALRELGMVVAVAPVSGPPG